MKYKILYRKLWQYFKQWSKRFKSAVSERLSILMYKSVVNLEGCPISLDELTQNGLNGYVAQLEFSLLNTISFWPTKSYPDTYRFSFNECNICKC